MAKVRYVKFHTDEFIAGVSGVMTPEQVGVYWMICSLHYSHGDYIDYDPKRLGNLLGGTNPRTIRRIVDSLVKISKVSLKGGLIGVERCAKELSTTGELIAEASANGAKGGRPRKENNDLGKGSGLITEKLTNNHEPITNNHKPTHKKIRGTSIASDWKPTERDLAYAKNKGYNSNKVNHLADSFLNYWLSSSGSSSIKKDWEAAWRSWILKDIQFNGDPEKKKRSKW